MSKAESAADERSPPSPQLENNNVLVDVELSREDSRSAELAASPRKVVINVGGTKFRVKLSNFARMAPKSRLFRLARTRTEEEALKLCDGYSKSGGVGGVGGSGGGGEEEFFFNRSSGSFNSILDFYRKGTLHMTTETCALVRHMDL